VRLLVPLALALWVSVVVPRLPPLARPCPVGCHCTPRLVSCRSLSGLDIELGSLPSVRLDLYNSSVRRVVCSPLGRSYGWADLRLVRPRTRLCEALDCANLRRIAVTSGKVRRYIVHIPAGRNERSIVS